MKNLFNYLARKGKRRKAFVKSKEFDFFIENRSLLMRLPQFISFYDSENDPFQVMRANIILASFINKKKIEEAINNTTQDFQKVISELPYYQDGEDRIYIPFFSRGLNQIYLNEPEKLLTESYRGLKEDFNETIIDPFDAYGSELYNSQFSHLVKVAEVDKETAYFHYDTNTIYFVNEQARLDARIVLFDRYIRHPNYENMLERIKPVVDAYFGFNREGLISALYENGFISAHLLHRIKFRDWAKL